MTKNNITYEELKILLNYDKNTGVFTWKTKKCKNVIVGSVAGGINKIIGYVQIRVNNKLYYAHRLAWLYTYGYMPENQIDHIDRDRTNNRINNLREVSQSCNTINSKKRKDNTAGVKGITLDKRGSIAWDSEIRYRGKKIYLGHFKDFSEAVKARWEAEKKYGFYNCCADSTAYMYLKENNLISDTQEG